MSFYPVDDGGSATLLHRRFGHAHGAVIARLIDSGADLGLDSPASSVHLQDLCGYGCTSCATMNTGDLDWLLLLLLIDIISRRRRIKCGASTRMGWHKWPLWATSARSSQPGVSDQRRLLNLEVGLTWKCAVGASGHFTVTRIVRRCTGRLAGIRPEPQNKLSRIERIAKLIGYKHVAPLLENYWTTILSVMSSCW